MDKPFLNRLFRYCCALTADETDAWDLLQASVEKYLLVCNRSGDFSVENQYAYMMRIIRNRHIDNVRQSAHAANEDFDELTHTDFGANSLEQTVIDENTVEHLWRILTMPEREVLFLWGVEEFTASEIALRLELPRGTVLARLARAKGRIADYCKQYGVG